VSALEQTQFDSQGLIPAIAQDFETGEILMFAWMNKESLALTIENNKRFIILALEKSCGLRVRSQGTHN